MKITNILLTGDDGYNAIGTRLLIHFLKDAYSLSIAATKHQQSGVGGKLSLGKAIDWEEIEVDGIKGISVDGTPGDAMDVADGYFKKHFDCVISGINLGINVGGSFFSSGTIAAALRALILKVSDKAIVFSLNVVDLSQWFKKHDVNEDISTYLDYPGKQVSEITNLIIKNEFWKSGLINVNFPFKKTNKIKFTKPLDDLKKFFMYPGTMDYVKKTYKHPMNIREELINPIFDSGAVQHGYISITPCKSQLLNENVYEDLQDVSIDLT